MPADVETAVADRHTAKRGSGGGAWNVALGGGQAQFPGIPFTMRKARAHAAKGYAPSPRRDSLPEMNAAIGTTIAMSSHEARGTTRKTKPIFALGCPKETSP